jgi:hypothetical protein
MSDPREGHLKLLFEHKASIPNGGLYPPDLITCAACGEQKSADSGHRLCWGCEGMGHRRGRKGGA